MFLFNVYKELLLLNIKLIPYYYFILNAHVFFSGSKLTRIMPACVDIGCTNRTEKGYKLTNFPTVWTTKVKRARVR